jgi:hypothetical protein
VPLVVVQNLTGLGSLRLCKGMQVRTERFKSSANILAKKNTAWKQAGEEFLKRDDLLLAEVAAIVDQTIDCPP